MPDLEQQLAELAGSVEWPATPNLVSRGRLLALPARRGRSGWGRTLAVAAAALILVLATLLAYTPTREAVAGWLNLHTAIHRTQQLPSASPLLSGPLGRRLGLGSPTTLAQAQAQVSWPIWVPPSLGEPDEVYVQVPPYAPSGGEVTLVYSARPGFKVSGQTGVSVLITEARGKVNEQFFSKTLGPGTTIEDISVDGHPGWWIAGKPHMFVITDPNGNAYSSTLRLATNTLVFEDSGTVIRVEGEMTRDQALKVAGSPG